MKQSFALYGQHGQHEYIRLQGIHVQVSRDKLIPRERVD